MSISDGARRHSRVGDAKRKTSSPSFAREIDDVGVGVVR